MFPKALTSTILLAVLTAGGTPAARAARVDAATIRADLRTADPNEEAYITYVVTLRDQGRLSNKLVESTFLWARLKPSHKKFQYFKHGLIAQAARIGVRLPKGTPDLTPTVNGRVVLRVLLIDVPVANATVSIRGTKLKTTTNAKGEFSFANVPLGKFTLDAKVKVLLISRTGSANIVLPTTPPSTQAGFVKIQVR